jgi:hypothetical protein
MTTSMLDAQWAADPTQPGRIAAGEAITIDVRIAFWRVVGGPTEEMRLVKETEALVVAAPAMAKLLRRVAGLACPAVTRYGRLCQEATPGNDCAVCEARRVLTVAGVPLP